MKELVFHPLTLAALFMVVGFACWLHGADTARKWRTEAEEERRKLLEQDIDYLRGIRADLIEEIQEISR